MAKEEQTTRQKRQKRRAEQENAAPHGKSGLFKPREPRPLDQFDFDVLSALPDEGAMKGRYMPDALTLAQIKKKLDAPELTTGFVSMRLRDLQDRGFTTSTHGAAIPGSGGRKGWQRTEEGKKVAMAQLPAAQGEAAQA